MFSPRSATTRIIGRVRLLRVLNPTAWKDASTYLRAEVEELQDLNESSDTTELQEMTKRST